MPYSDTVINDIYTDSKRIDPEVSNKKNALLGGLLVMVLSSLIVVLWSWSLLHFGI